MKKKATDKIKESYHQHESELDHDKLWAAVSGGQTKKKKRGLFWVFFGASLLIISLALYQFNIGFGDSMIVNDGLSANEYVGGSELRKQKSDVRSKEEKLFLEQSLNLNEIGNPNESKAVSKSQEQTIAENARFQKVKTKPANISKRNEALTSQSNKPTRKVVGLDRANELNKIQGEGEKIRKAGGEMIVDERSGSVNVGHNIESTVNEYLVDAETRQLISEDIVEAALIYEVTELNSNDSLSSFPKLPLMIIELIPHRRIPRMTLEYIDPKIEEGLAEANKEVEAKKGRISLTASSSVYLFADQFEGMTDYDIVRADSEKELEAFGGNLMVDYQLKNGLGLHSGLAYQRTNRKLFWANEYFGDRFGNFIEAHNPNAINPDFVGSNFSGDTLAVFFIKNEIIRFNETHTFSIPLQLSYSKQWDKFSINVFGGTAIHLFQNVNADVISSDLQLWGQKNVGNIKIKPDLLVGFATEFTLTPQLNLVGKLNYKYRSVEEENISRRTQFYGIGLGLRYVFGAN